VKNMVAPDTACDHTALAHCMLDN